MAKKLALVVCIQVLILAAADRVSAGEERGDGALVGKVDAELAGERVVVPDEPAGFHLGLDLGYGMALFSHQITGEDDDILVEKWGMLYGPKATLTCLTSNLMIKPEVQYLQGGSSYRGPGYDGDPIDTDADNRLIEGRALIGIAIEDGIFCFTGLGYRDWNTEIQGIGGYNSNIRQYYLPLGIEAPEGSYLGRWGAAAELDVLLVGLSMFHVSDDGFTDDARYWQGPVDALALRFSGTYRPLVSRTISLTIEPFLLFWLNSPFLVVEKGEEGEEEWRIDSHDKLFMIGLTASLCW